MIPRATKNAHKEDNSEDDNTETVLLSLIESVNNHVDESYSEAKSPTTFDQAISSKNETL